MKHDNFEVIAEKRYRIAAIQRMTPSGTLAGIFEGDLTKEALKDIVIDKIDIIKQCSLLVLQSNWYTVTYKDGYFYDEVANDNAIVKEYTSETIDNISLKKLLQICENL